MSLKLVLINIRHHEASYLLGGICSTGFEDNWAFRRKSVTEKNDMKNHKAGLVRKMTEHAIIYYIYSI